MNHLCVSHSDLCDGADDCGDSSDESGTVCSNYIKLHFSNLLFLSP